MPRATNNNISGLQVSLLDWFNANGRSFPWRKPNLNNFEIIIAEVLLQRTKAETVSSFFSNFVADFPGWGAITQADDIELQNYLKPIGLYRQRASRLKSLALEMVKRNGKLPQNRQELESIPFFGQYIANAVELIIFNKPSPLVDVNMSRLLERYFGERKMADIRYDPYLQNLSKKLVNSPRSKEINWAVLDYAALVCKARSPICPSCALNKKCTFYKSNNQKMNCIS